MEADCSSRSHAHNKVMTVLISRTYDEMLKAYSVTVIIQTKNKETNKIS